MNFTLNQLRIIIENIELNKKVIQSNGKLQCNTFA